MNRCWRHVVAALTVAAGVAWAAPPDAAPEFDAASIRVNNSHARNSSSQGTRGLLAITNQSLKQLIESAWLVQPFQVAGPSWLGDVRFDITAKYPADAKEMDQPLMLRSLLADRLKLRAHVETKEMNGYALVAGKGGFRLKPVEPGREDTTTSGRVIRTLKATSVSLDDIAEWLSTAVEGPVENKTGIDGVYDFNLRWSKDDLQNDPSGAPSLFTAIEETTGLQLRAEKIRAKTIVVDSAERTPAEN